MDKKIIKLLYRSFDNHLNQTEKQILEKALNESGELQSFRDSLAEIRNSIKKEEKIFFSDNFTNNVMDSVYALRDHSKDELFFESIYNVFKPIAIAATFLLVFMLAYNILSNGRINEKTELTLVDAFDPYHELTLE